MTVHKPDWMTPTDTGYRATCGWSKEYPKKTSARGGLSAHKCKPKDGPPVEGLRSLLRF